MNCKTCNQKMLIKEIVDDKQNIIGITTTCQNMECGNSAITKLKTADDPLTEWLRIPITRMLIILSVGATIGFILGYGVNKEVGAALLLLPMVGGILIGAATHTTPKKVKE